MTAKIPLNRPYFDSEELTEIQKVLDSGWVSQGPKTKEFEDKIADYLGVKYAIAVTNCTSALHLSLLGIGVRKGDEVLVSDYTFPASANAVLYCGAKPVFIDVDSRTYNIDLHLIEKKITSKTKAIIPVHTFGQPALMYEIIKIAKKYGLNVIEDAACALGAKYKNKYAGTIGDIGCFSLHARKGITTGEGGILVTNKKDLAEKIRSLSCFGMVPTAWDRETANKFTIPKFTAVGYNYKMSDISAAIGIAQLKKLDKIIEKKRALAKYWDKKLKDIEFVKTPYADKDASHIYQSYVVLVDRRIDRDKMIERLKKRGIQTQIGTYALHIQSIYNSTYKCPNSLEVFRKALALPIYYRLNEKDIDAAYEIIKEELRKCITG